MLEEPLKLSIDLVNSSPDIQCMHAFTECLEIMNDSPSEHRKAALKWMNSIIELEVEKIATEI